jgi:antitoxin PrlF
MEVPATVTSKGQITIPARVRKALGLAAGDRVIFRLADEKIFLRAEDNRYGEAELGRVPDFFELAGTVRTPPGVDPSDYAGERSAAWEEAVRESR